MKMGLHYESHRYIGQHPVRTEPERLMFASSKT